ncbi:MAG: ribonuclease Y [Caldisericaceae bacterium]|nr:ribonuclease Y [Caldisericaceae bacterium]
MLTVVLIILIAIIAFGLGWFLNSWLGQNSLKRAEQQAKEILELAQEEAENEKKEKLLEAEEEIFQQKQQLEDEFESKKKTLQQLENELANRENNLDRKVDLIHKKERELFIQERELKNLENQLNRKQEKLDQLFDEQNKKLETIAGLTREEAKQLLMDNLIESAKKEASSTVYKIMEDAQKEAQSKAKDIIISAMQQSASDHAIESTVAVVTLPNDEMKGRIIGREGRNIRAFEIVTGIDVIVDDTPEAVILSGYDPFRRELARLTMEKLVNDGRIHPGRIEETYEKTVQEMNEYLRELGEQALIDVGLHGLHPDLIYLLGKLRYRTSFGQNVLQHSKEVAIIAGIMAAELGLDEQVARRAGLLHDIGRAVDRRNVEGDHAELGYELAKKYGENAIVLNAIAGHHGDVEPISPITILVQIANDISRSRPGARREVIENFVSRMTSFEEIALSFEGVKAAYAIQAGKEVRVIVDHEKVDDVASFNLAMEIAKKIQNETDYPGQVKVVVIREFRALDFA